MINNMKKVDKSDITKDISSKLNCKPPNEVLREKYDDI